MKCRFCGNTEFYNFANLGHMPPSNSLLSKEDLENPETYYPLNVKVCSTCMLAQIPETKKANEIFSDDYVYYSSQSPSNVTHAKEIAKLVRDKFPHRNVVLEIGSNDGYMLQFFKELGYITMGVDPAEGPVKEAIKNNINTFRDFFTADWVIKNKISADIILGINVLAHQPDLHGFVEGLKLALSEQGIIIMEFPYIMDLIDNVEFDTIYHEHYNYFSLAFLMTLFNSHGLKIFSVDKIPQHGGSLRIYVRHDNPDQMYPKENHYKIFKMIGEEIHRHTYVQYNSFQFRVNFAKRDLMNFLLSNSPLHTINVIAYGAAAKASVLFNYCGITPDLIPYVVDKSPHKQGKYTPGTHIPIVDESVIKKFKPSYVLITAWNIKDEVAEQLSYVREWGGEFVTAIPRIKIW